MLNGFVALEALFPGEALRKEKIAKKLGISKNTAELLKDLRDTLFHSGVSIKDAIDLLIETKDKYADTRTLHILKALARQPNCSWVIYSAFTDLMFVHFATIVGMNPDTVKRQSNTDLLDDRWFQKLPNGSD